MPDRISGHRSSQQYYSQQPSYSQPSYSQSTSGGHHTSTSGGYGSGGYGGAPPSGGGPSSDPYAGSAARREDIARQAQQYQSCYGGLVGPVNSALQRGGYGITQQSYESVMGNLQGVANGSMHQYQAHGNEARGFARDAAASFSRGQYGQGSMEAAGSAINTAGAAFYGTANAYAQGKHGQPTTPERRGNDPW